MTTDQKIVRTYWLLVDAGAEPQRVLDGLARKYQTTPAAINQLVNDDLQRIIVGCLTGAVVR